MVMENIDSFKILSARVAMEELRKAVDGDTKKINQAGKSLNGWMLKLGLRGVFREETDERVAASELAHAFSVAEESVLKEFFPKPVGWR